ncbi:MULTISPECIES: LIC_12616 family protein [Paenibacillus]|uniref:Phage neck terminator protein gp12-like domain-containing protein n=1 Tax=Paenibacillus radicis (ex Xue et al. 2023) TaxID=2972489 RepID=A0ABT1YUQ2_9BACL|nr:hypothetical protein [Paenibacillus radicis (ex Xue et al. 2023)]MCR8636180.1 hypothetical protein [Paenibacillus radicis (ex Xue et al. 2023)]
MNRYEEKGASCWTVFPMINLEQIRSSITTGLVAAMTMPVVELDDASAPAAYPFIKYSFSGPVLFPDKQPSVTVVPSSSPDEVIERYTEQPTFRMSFISCSDQKMDSLTNAVRMHDWFRILGRDELKLNANIVVVLAGEIQNRDIQIGNIWERRNSFEVTFKTLSVIDTKQTTIDIINWK